MYLPRTRHLQPLAGERPALELDVNLSAGLSEREVAGPKAQDEVVRLEERLAEVQVGDLQVLEADVFTQPKPLDLVEHGRMGGVVVHPVGAAGHDDAHFRHVAACQRSRVLLGVRGGVANLHRAGVRAQAVGLALLVVHVDVEGVLHRTRGMVGRVVQRGEVEPVVLDLGPVAHVKAHAGEDLLDALPCPADGVQATLPALAPRQGHIQRLGLQLALQLGVGQRLAALGQGRLDALLGQVDGGAAGFFLVDAELGHALHQLGHAAGFAEELRLGVFQIGGSVGARKGFGSAPDKLVQIGDSDSRGVHRQQFRNSTNEKGIEAR